MSSASPVETTLESADQLDVLVVELPRPLERLYQLDVVEAALTQLPGPLPVHRAAHEIT